MTTSAPDRRFLLARLPLLGSVLALTAWAAPGLLDWLTTAVPLGSAVLAVHAFPPARLERWCARGWLVATDAAAITLALVVGLPGRPRIVFGVLAAVALAVLVGERRRTMLVAGVLGVAALAAAAPAGARAEVVLESALALAVWLAAAAAFGTLASRLATAAGGDEARRQSREQGTLLHIVDTIGSTLEVGEVMRSIVRQVGELMRVEGCSILVLDDRLGGCFVLASKGHPEIDMLQVDLGKYPEVRRALETRQPVVVEDVATSPLVASVRTTLIEKGYRSLLVVPLVYGRDVLGALFVRTRREEAFRADEIRFCQLVAGASANALKNALLYRDVAAEAERHRVTAEKLRRVVDGTPDLIVATDPDGRIAEFNRGAEALTGWTAERAIGCAFGEVFGEEVERSVGTDSGFVDVVYRRFDGTPLEVSLSSAPLPGPDGTPAGRVWIGRDVTQLRRVEKSLAQAERLSSLGEVVAGVAHELNNPLSGVLGYAELLRKNAADEQQLHDLERIVESSLRCQRIVFKLLSFARKHPPEKRRHSLNECVSKVLDLKAYHLRSSQIVTKLELPESLPETSFDFHQIEQVLLNLINNAEQAITSMRAPGSITLRTGSAGGAVYVEVEDDGPGVPEAIRDRIFDPFFTTKEVGQGTGLGLAVSYGIVREHGGRIEHAPGRGGRGAKFVLVLPIVETEDEPRADAPAGTAETGGRLAGRRILVVEDDPLVRELFQRVLAEDGADVAPARDGREALERITAGEFDLIVADLRMPDIDGQQLYEAIAERRPDLLRRFVFATGDLARQETVRFLESVPNRILTKPLEVETVRRVLSQALEPARAS